MTEGPPDPQAQPTPVDLAWYFDPARIWMKGLRFVDLMDDKLPRLSGTKIMFWATSFGNACAYLFSHDNQTRMVIGASNAVAVIGKIFKRYR